MCDFFYMITGKSKVRENNAIFGLRTYPQSAVFLGETGGEMCESVAVGTVAVA